MLSAAITCAKSSVTSGPRCEPLYLDLADATELPDAAAKALSKAGWTEKDSEHYCPRHNPSDSGVLLEIAPVVYVPVGDSGWEIRLPEAGFALGEIQVEIRRRPGPADTS